MKLLLIVINDPKRPCDLSPPTSLHVPWLLIYLDEFRFTPSLESPLGKTLYGFLWNGLWVWKLQGRKHLLSPTFQARTCSKSQPLWLRSWKTTRVATFWGFSSRSDQKAHIMSTIEIPLYLYICTSTHLHSFSLFIALSQHFNDLVFSGR